MKKSTVIFGILTIPSLALFFGLFFGLNYKEIVRSGWPLTSCTIVYSTTVPRYCCEISCSGCLETNSPSTPKCSNLQSSSNQINPLTCAANNATCPSSTGVECDDGYYCCSTCCDTCRSCKTTCSGSDSKSCTTSCTTSSCNCRCCNWVNHQWCTLSCPECFSVNLGLSYTTRSGQHIVNTTYSQDFRKDQIGADNFRLNHDAGSKTGCYYNPQHTEQVLLDVSYTPWKWGVSAAFGMLPLAICLSYFAAMFIVRPCFKFAKSGWRNLGNPPQDQDRSSSSDDSEREVEDAGRSGRRWLPPILDKSGKPVKAGKSIGGLGYSNGNGKEKELDAGGDEDVARPPAYDDVTGKNGDADSASNREREGDGSEVKEVHSSHRPPSRNSL